MRNIKVTIMYDGTGYQGWQRLKEGNEDNSIQGMLERSLTVLLSESIKLIGSGRTDAGVHALGQIANFNTNSKRSIQDINQRLNEMLPEDIATLTMQEVNKNFHSRFDATEKLYEYRFDTKERASVFSRKYFYSTGCRLDVEAMRKAAAPLHGEHDFKAYCTDRKDGKSTIRTIFDIQVEERKSDGVQAEVILRFRGNGFLHHMARVMAGTLLEVGTHVRSIESVETVLRNKERKQAGILLYPQGLFLVSVSYVHATKDTKQEGFK